VFISGIYRVIFKLIGSVFFQGHKTPRDPIINPKISDWIVLLNLLSNNDIILENNIKPDKEPKVNTAIILSLLIVYASFRNSKSTFIKEII
jgi:hypothetical protein